MKVAYLSVGSQISDLLPGLSNVDTEKKEALTTEAYGFIKSLHEKYQDSPESSLDDGEVRTFENLKSKIRFSIKTPVPTPALTTVTA